MVDASRSAAVARAAGQEGRRPQDEFVRGCGRSRGTGNSSFPVQDSDVYPKEYCDKLYTSGSSNLPPPSLTRREVRFDHVAIEFDSQAGFVWYLNETATAKRFVVNDNVVHPATVKEYRFADKVVANR